MAIDRIVCLANSYKHDNRCVAGISLITKKWVRLVGNARDRILTREDTRFEDGFEVRPLDIFEVETGESCATCYHPEDVLCLTSRWNRMGRLSIEDKPFLNEFVSSDPIALEGYCDRVQCERFEQKPARMSLALVHPGDLWWWVREEHGKRRNRAVFRLGSCGRVRFDLPLTDPACLDQLNLLPTGIYPDDFITGERNGTCLLTLSLSEPFEGFHYKLVAGVIHL